MEQLVKVESIKPLGQQDVYNMEVDEFENYSVDGGMIIHNCIDALRYSVEPYSAQHKNNKVILLPRTALGL